MPKPLLNTHDLVESDFRKIQKLLNEKYNQKFTLDYIRKVCKGKRSNENIAKIAAQYMDLLIELEKKIEELTMDKS